MQHLVGEIWMQKNGLAVVILEDCAVPVTMVRHSLEAEMAVGDLLLCPPLVSKSVGLGLKFRIGGPVKLEHEYRECLGYINENALQYVRAAQKVLVTGERAHLRALQETGTLAWLHY
jgi:hypothetical protein